MLERIGAYLSWGALCFVLVFVIVHCVLCSCVGHGGIVSRITSVLCLYIVCVHCVLCLCLCIVLVISGVSNIGD